jgi:hypothetical protein
MPRPCCKRAIHYFSKFEVFKPNGIPLNELEEVMLSLDELEALRLSDFSSNLWAHHRVCPKKNSRCSLKRKSIKNNWRKRPP